MPPVPMSLIGTQGRYWSKLLISAVPPLSSIERNFRLEQPAFNWIQLNADKLLDLKGFSAWPRVQLNATCARVSQKFFEAVKFDLRPVRRG